jgi:CRP/FNR family cyclic AMP-dependent transcriptional regulator
MMMDITSHHLLRGVSSVDQTFQPFSECALFRRLERRQIEALFARAQIRDFAAGETIFVTGSPADSMMIVLRGKVRIDTASPKGQPPPAIRLPGSEGAVGGHSFAYFRSYLSPGETFGEIALLDGGARLADAIANTECRLAIVDRHDMLAFLEQNPGAWQDIASMLRERLRHMPVDREGRQQYANLTEIALLHAKSGHA